MLIYNTLTKKKETFIPVSPGNIKIYVCGPTVYDYFHIGNARSFIMADMIRRYFEYKSFNVTYVMNLTDIDDKIINKSKEEKIAFNKVADKYTAAFFEDIEKLKTQKGKIKNVWVLEVTDGKSTSSFYITKDTRTVIKGVSIRSPQVKILGKLVFIKIS